MDPQRVTVEQNDAPTGEGASTTEAEAETGIAEAMVDVAENDKDVSDSAFDEMVRGAIEPLGGTLLFEMRVFAETGQEYTAAAAIGEGRERQCLVLSRPVSGGKLTVEPAARSRSPAAPLAVSLAVVVEAFSRAA